MTQACVSGHCTSSIHIPACSHSLYFAVPCFCTSNLRSPQWIESAKGIEWLDVALSSYWCLRILIFSGNYYPEVNQATSPEALALEETHWICGGNSCFFSLQLIGSKWNQTAGSTHGELGAATERVHWKPLPEIQYSSDSSHFSYKCFISASSCSSLALYFKYCSSLVFWHPSQTHMVTSHSYTHGLISTKQPNTYFEEQVGRIHLLGGGSVSDPSATA